MVVHYLGDIHQPLHITAEVDSEYPAGDKGGNKESLPNHGGAYNLHSVWDSIIYEYTGYPRTPLHDSDWTWYTLEAEDLATNYPYDSDLLYPEQYQQWADEGLEISIEDVYPGIVEDQMPTEAYQLNALDAIRPRIIIGGRRLADLIVNIYDKQVKFLSE